MQRTDLTVLPGELVAYVFQFLDVITLSRTVDNCGEQIITQAAVRSCLANNEHLLIEQCIESLATEQLENHILKKWKHIILMTRQIEGDQEILLSQFLLLLNRVVEELGHCQGRILINSSFGDQSRYQSIRSFFHTHKIQHGFIYDAYYGAIFSTLELLKINTSEHTRRFSSLTMSMGEALTWKRSRVRKIEFNIDPTTNEDDCPAIVENMKHLASIVAKNPNIVKVVIQTPEPISTKVAQYQVLTSILQELSTLETTIQVNATLLDFDRNTDTSLNAREIIIRGQDHSHMASMLLASQFDSIKSLDASYYMDNIEFCQTIQTSETLKHLYLDFDTCYWQHARVSVDKIRRAFAMNQAITHVTVRCHASPNSDHSITGFSYFECIGWLRALHTLHLIIPFFKLDELFNPLVIASVFEMVRHKRHSSLECLTISDVQSDHVMYDAMFTKELLHLVLTCDHIKKLVFQVHGIVLFQIICKMIKKKFNRMDLVRAEFYDFQKLYRFRFTCSSGVDNPCMITVQFNSEKLDELVERAFLVVQDLTGVSGPALCSYLHHFKVCRKVIIEQDELHLHVSDKPTAITL
jgi:hypothetical protein